MLCTKHRKFPHIGCMGRLTWSVPAKITSATGATSTISSLFGTTSTTPDSSFSFESSLLAIQPPPTELVWPHPPSCQITWVWFTSICFKIGFKNFQPFLYQVGIQWTLICQLFPQAFGATPWECEHMINSQICWNMTHLISVHTSFHMEWCSLQQIFENDCGYEFLLQ